MTIAVPQPRYKSAFRLRMEASMDAVVCTHRCDCGYTVTGPTGEAREKIRAHRVAEHPERPAIAKRPKKPKKPRYELNAEEVKILNDLAERQKARKRKPRRASVPKKPHGRPRSRFAARITRDELNRLYYVDHLSMYAIGDKYGVSHVTVRTALQDHGVPIRSGGPPPLITPERREAAWKLYDAGMSTIDIAKLAYEAWGFNKVESARRCLGYSFVRSGRTLRIPSESIRQSNLCTITHNQARATLLEAEATRGDTNK